MLLISTTTHHARLCIASYSTETHETKSAAEVKSTYACICIIFICVWSTSSWPVSCIQPLQIASTLHNIPKEPFLNQTSSLQQSCILFLLLSRQQLRYTMEQGLRKRQQGYAKRNLCSEETSNYGWSGFKSLCKLTSVNMLQCCFHWWSLADCRQYTFVCVPQGSSPPTKHRQEGCEPADDVLSSVRYFATIQPATAKENVYSMLFVSFPRWQVRRPPSTSLKITNIKGKSAPTTEAVSVL